MNGVDVSDRNRYYTGAELDKLPKEVKDTIWKAKSDKGLLVNKKPRKVNAVDTSNEKNFNEGPIVKWGTNTSASESNQGWGGVLKGGKQGSLFVSNAYDEKDVTEVGSSNGWTNTKS